MTTKPVQGIGVVIYRQATAEHDMNHIRLGNGIEIVRWGIEQLIVPLPFCDRITEHEWPDAVVVIGVILPHDILHDVGNNF